jgi:hypothetical protein
MQLETTPRRIQLRRCRGWRKPANTVVVARPTRWGNPFKADAPEAGRTRAWAVEQFKGWASNNPAWVAAARTELHGRNLACWCPIGEPCHADVLLALVNPRTCDMSAAASTPPSQATATMEWTPAAMRLPEKSDADCYDMVWCAVERRVYQRTWDSFNFREFPEWPNSHWRPTGIAIPRPPETPPERIRGIDNNSQTQIV